MIEHIAESAEITFLKDRIGMQSIIIAKLEQENAELRGEPFSLSPEEKRKRDRERSSAFNKLKEQNAALGQQIAHLNAALTRKNAEIAALKAAQHETQPVVRPSKGAMRLLQSWYPDLQ